MTRQELYALRADIVRGRVLTQDEVLELIEAYDEDLAYYETADYEYGELLELGGAA